MVSDCLRKFMYSEIYVYELLMFKLYRYNMQQHDKYLYKKIVFRENSI